jgi:hypothetical protein
MHAGVHGGEHQPVPLSGGYEGRGRVMGDVEQQTGPALVCRQVLRPVAAREDGSAGAAREPDEGAGPDLDGELVPKMPRVVVVDHVFLPPLSFIQGYVI